MCPCTAGVIDGGYLLHAVKWQSQSSYADIAQQYVRFIRSHFGDSAAIVFDGYCNGPSIKDHEHQRRSVAAGPTVAFAGDLTAYRNQAAFLANNANKQQFVGYLMTQLETAGYSVHQAVNDADTLIVCQALAQAKFRNVTVVANDTDIFIMLLYHFQSHLFDIYWHPQSGRRTLDRKHSYIHSHRKNQSQ